MDKTFCQSCAMPMDTEEVKGTNADGSKNEEYCVYCFQHGDYTKLDATMEEMIEMCVPHMNHLTPDEARRQMQEYFPKLKRWQQQ